MKYAIVENERREAAPNLSGECPVCGKAMVAKCGRHRVHHWAHQGKRTCDPWWENETDWHRDWKNHFPKHWQEFIRYAKNGEKHIADVNTDGGVVIEFQHSFLHEDERQARETFYQKMVWVVDGRRRKLDKRHFFACIVRSVAHYQTRIVSIPWTESALLREWAGSRVPVYFDFGESEPTDAARFDTPTLWRLTPHRPNGMAYLTALPKTSFLHIHRTAVPFEETCTEAVKRDADRLFLKQASQPLPSFERYMAKRNRRRPRF